MGTWNSMHIYTRRRHCTPPIGAVTCWFSAVLHSFSHALFFMFNTDERNALIRAWRFIGPHCFDDSGLEVDEASDVSQVEAIWKYQFSLERVIGRSQLFLLCQARYLLLVNIQQRHERLSER